MGYSEYARALSLLEPLVLSASTAELQLIDEMIAERSEFVVYTNLSRRIPTTRPSALNAPAQDADGYARRGLAWVMALARVELGAMLAGYTDKPEPFAVLPPTNFERVAFGDVLLDGARTHYFALANDPAAQAFLAFRDRPLTAAERERGRAGVNESQAIAYGRRAALAREFVRAVQNFGRGQWTAEQAAELRGWENDLTMLVETIAFSVLGLGDQTVGSIGTTTSVQHTKRGAILTCLRCDPKGRPAGGTSGTAGGTVGNPKGPPGNVSGPPQPKPKAGTGKAKP